MYQFVDTMVSQSALRKSVDERMVFDFKYRRGKELYLNFKLKGVLRGRGNLSAPCSANYAPQDAEPGSDSAAPCSTELALRRKG